MRLTYDVRTVWGKYKRYPTGKKQYVIESLTGERSLSTYHIKALEELGHTVVANHICPIAELDSFDRERIEDKTLKYLT